jgi:hypothetical protein
MIGGWGLKGRAGMVARTSKSAVSRVSKPAGRTTSYDPPIWKGLPDICTMPAAEPRRGDIVGSSLTKTEMPPGRTRFAHASLTLHFSIANVNGF